MNYKTQDEVENDIAQAIYAELKAGGLKGRLYLSDRRNESTSEDCAIRCTALVNSSCYQEGVVNVNVYIPFVDYGDRTKAKHTERVIEIQNVLKDINRRLIVEKGKMDLIRKGYYFQENEGMFTYSVEGKNESMINNKLNFKYYGTRV